MPDSTATITRQQRDGLYELVRNHLASIEDFWVALERRGDFATAERLAIEFTEDFRLLDDIGWEPQHGRDTVKLTMPAEDLTELLRRLRGESEAFLAERGSEREASRGDARTDGRFRAGRYACEAVLASLGRPGGERS